METISPSKMYQQSNSLPIQSNPQQQLPPHPHQFPPSSSSSSTSSSHINLPPPNNRDSLLSSSSQGQFTFSLETPSLSSGTLDKYLKSVLGSDSSTAIPDLLKPAGSNEGGMSSNPSHSVDFNAKMENQKPQQMNQNAQQQQHQQQQQQLPMVQHQQQQQQQQHHEVNNQQLTTTEMGGEMIPMPRGQAYVDITEYLNMPQSDAAKKLGIPPSTLSKRWKEAVRKRKWPYRMICKIDKEIMTLLHNVPQGPNAPPLPEEIEAALGTLLRRRQEELRPVVIRI
eukprot:TRINITY_DN1865_c0_g1_i2.p1 TRINITY_DN1865_c0_g1~~TRINITY_DN1865_c0_g1_i2.p1  ORF type:complete len:282 (-),score=119.22 TRINITY_DN1865_c0_g1_i2:125-970(-)